MQDTFYCQQDRTEELSKRMFSRNVPDVNMETAYFDRPAHTRKITMPILDCKKNDKGAYYSTYNTTNFNPGTSAPFSGYATNVDTESDLFSRNYILEDCDEHTYVPGSKSDLYDNEYLVVGRKVKDPHQELQVGNGFNKFNPNKCKLGKQMFGNHTRQQRMDIKFKK